MYDRYIIIIFNMKLNFKKIQKTIFYLKSIFKHYQLKNLKILILNKHSLPAILSFFIPGLGQLIKGHFLKAFVIWILSGIIGYFLLWTVIIPLGFWIWNIYDAYNSQ